MVLTGRSFFSFAGTLEADCSLMTKMQLSCEGKPDTGCLQVTFRSLWKETLP